MIEDIKKLKNGEAVECPVYDYTIHNRSSETVNIAPRSIILIEGILIFPIYGFVILWILKYSSIRMPISVSYAE